MQIKCTSCGANQELSLDQKCEYCGVAIEEIKAQENFKIATSGEIGNLMMMAETAIDATNWEEALQFYNQVLTKDITNSDAWLGKGIAIVYTSKIGDIKTTEAIAYWKNATKHAKNPIAMGKRVAKEINIAISSFYPIIQNHFLQFKDLEDSYLELFSKFLSLEKALNYANEIDNSNLLCVENGYVLCQSVEKLLNVAKNIAERDSILPDLSGTTAYDVQEFKEKQKKALGAIARKSNIDDKLNELLKIKNIYKNCIIEIKPDHSLISEANIKSEKEELISRNVDEEFSKVKEIDKKHAIYVYWGFLLGMVFILLIFLSFTDFFVPIANILGAGITTICLVAIGGYFGARIGQKIAKNKSTKTD